MSWFTLSSVIAGSLLFSLRGEANETPRPLPDYAPITAIRQPSDFTPDELAAYAEISDAAQNEPMGAEPYSLQPQFEPIGTDAETECCEACGSSECEYAALNYRSGWTLVLEASALQSQMASSDHDAWPDDFGAAGRVSLAYEGNNGVGIRAQAWGYSMTGPAYFNYYVYNYYIDYDYGFYPYRFNTFYPALVTNSRDFELSMATTFLDFYKAITSRNGELLVGAGPAFGHLELNSPPYGDGVKYFGGGISAFSHGSFAVLQRPRWAVGLTGQARVTLLTGDWQIEEPFGGVSGTSEHSKSMSIVELAIGPEFRRRFGRSANHYWFVRTLAEFQQWRSDRMGPMAGDTLALQGATASFGVNW